MKRSYLLLLVIPRITCTVFSADIKPHVIVTTDITGRLPARYLQYQMKIQEGAYRIAYKRLNVTI